MSVDLTDIDIKILFKELWNNAKTASFYEISSAPKPMYCDPKKYNTGFWYHCGRPLKIDFSNLRDVRYGEYDICNGQGKFLEILSKLNDKKNPYLLKDFTQTEKEGKTAIEVHSPQCPNCFNVDGRLTLKHDKINATIEIIETFQTSGYLVKCICCNTTFKWCAGNVDYGILAIEHQRENDVLVPIEYFSKILGVDVYKYV